MRLDSAQRADEGIDRHKEWAGGRNESSMDFGGSHISFVRG